MVRGVELRSGLPKRRADAVSKAHHAFAVERIPNKVFKAGVAFAADRTGLDRSTPHRRLTQSLLANSDQPIRISGAEHLTLIASAYAAFILLQREPDYSTQVADLARTLGVRVTKRTDPLTIILRSAIKYPEGNSGNEARKRYERDAKAIRHLISQRIDPADIHEEAKPKGEGLDAWSRRYRVDQRVDSPSRKAVRPLSSADAVRSPAVPRSNPPTAPSHRAISVVSSHGTLTLATLKPADSQALDLFLELIQQRQSRKHKRGWRLEDEVVFSLLKKAVGHQDIPYLNLAEKMRQHRLTLAWVC